MSLFVTKIRRVFNNIFNSNDEYDIMESIFDNICENSDKTLTKLLPDVFSDEIEWDYTVVAFNSKRINNIYMELEISVNHVDLPSYCPKIKCRITKDHSSNYYFDIVEYGCYFDIMNHPDYINNALNNILIEKVNKCWSAKKILGK